MLLLFFTMLIFLYCALGLFVAVNAVCVYVILMNLSVVCIQYVAYNDANSAAAIVV